MIFLTFQISNKQLFLFSIINSFTFLFTSKMNRIIYLLRHVRNSIPKSLFKSTPKVDGPIRLSTSKAAKITLDDTLHEIGLKQKVTKKNNTFKFLCLNIFLFLGIVYYCRSRPPSTENASLILREMEEEAMRLEEEAKKSKLRENIKL